MKKYCSLLLILVISFSSFSQSYKSNILMQKLSDSSDSEYVLEVDGDTERLFKNGVLYKESHTLYEESFDHQSITRTVTDIINGIEETYTYTDSYLTSYLYDDGLDSYRINYNYNESGSLIFTTVITDSSSDIECYLRDGLSGDLIGIKKSDSYIWTGSNYLSSEDYLLTEIAVGVFVEDDFTVNEDSIVYTKDGTEYTYSNFGLLIQVKDPSGITEYFYNDDNSLSATVFETDNKRVISNYKNGVMTDSITFVDDLISESVVYKQTGMVKTLYSSGKAIADVQYDRNNIKVLDIRYY